MFEDPYEKYAIFSGWISAYTVLSEGCNKLKEIEPSEQVFNKFNPSGIADWEVAKKFFWSSWKFYEFLLSAPGV